MELKVEPMQLEEIDDFVQVFWDAFEPVENDTVLPMIYACGLTDEVFERLRQRTIGMCDNDISKWCYAAKDAATGQVVGISQWDVVNDPPKTQAELDAKWEEANRHRLGRQGIKGANAELGGAFLKASTYSEYEVTGGKPFVTLKLLATKPGFGRKGVGAALLRYGLAKFDGLGLPTYLDASGNGINLYKKFGFEVKKDMPFDGRDYGGRSPAKHWCMLRPAQDTKKTETS